MRRGGKPAKAKVEAKRPVARKSRKRQSARVGHLEKRLAEALKREAQALEQQTATSEILRVISSSPTDVQPVFNTVVQSGLRLLGGYSATMMLLRDDDRLDLVAYTSTSAEADASLVHAFPCRFAAFQSASVPYMSGAPTRSKMSRAPRTPPT